MTYVHMHARDVGVTEIRTKAKAPDGSEIWVSDPKNSVERLASVLVIERRSTAARYMCTKCSLMFWGSKKRIKEHLRGQGNSVTGCVCVCVCVCECARSRLYAHTCTCVCCYGGVYVCSCLCCTRTRVHAYTRKWLLKTFWCIDTSACVRMRKGLARTHGWTRKHTSARAHTHTHTYAPRARAPSLTQTT